MIQVKIREKTYDADYAGIGYLGFFKMQLKDGRPLSLIAPEVEGAETITVIAEGKELIYTGFTELVQIGWVDNESVILVLRKCLPA